MAIIPEIENTIQAKLNAFDAEELTINNYTRKSDKVRPYLGMSSIGDSCMRKLWYGFHWVCENKKPRRVLRIFERGDWAEHRIVRDLKLIGVNCFRRGEEGNKIEITGAVDEEQETLTGFAGHSKGHTDGRCDNVPGAEKTEHLAEFKSANDKNFKKFVKLGVKEAHPVYYGQLQRYMHETKLKRALFIVENKNDETRYAERVYYDKDHAEDLCRKEMHIITAEEPPAKIGESTWFECKWCDKNEVCHSNDNVLQNCRTCDSSDIENEGKWSCNGKELSIDEQKAGCKMWKKGWGL